MTDSPGVLLWLYFYEREGYGPEDAVYMAGAFLEGLEAAIQQPEWAQALVAAAYADGLERPSAAEITEMVDAIPVERVS